MINGSGLRVMEWERWRAEELYGELSALTAGIPADAVFSDVEAALDALGALTGRSVQEDVTDRIFSRFCVGK